MRCLSRFQSQIDSYRRRALPTSLVCQNSKRPRGTDHLVKRLMGRQPLAAKILRSVDHDAVGIAQSHFPQADIWAAPGAFTTA
jgi:hypothetical protein